MSQATDLPSGQGFNNSLKIDVTTADSSVGAAQYAIIRQCFEGQFLQRLQKGFSTAKSSTVSFWVKSGLTGTHICRLYDHDNSRQISKSYTIDTSGFDDVGAMTKDEFLKRQEQAALIDEATYLYQCLKFLFFVCRYRLEKIHIYFVYYRLPLYYQ